MKVKRSVFVLTMVSTFALGMAGATALQDGDGADGKAGDGAVAGMQMPAPIEDAELEKLVGHWTWDAQIFDAEAGKWMPMKGEDEWK